MSATLDKSLDDIISSGKKTRVANKKRVAAARPATKVGKKVGSAKKPIVLQKKATPAGPSAAAIAKHLDLTYATKVVVHGLPRDIKQDGIKVCSG